MTRSGTGCSTRWRFRYRRRCGVGDHQVAGSAAGGVTRSGVGLDDPYLRADGLARLAEALASAGRTSAHMAATAARAAADTIDEPGRRAKALAQAAEALAGAGDTAAARTAASAVSAGVDTIDSQYTRADALIRVTEALARVASRRP